MLPSTLFSIIVIDLIVVFMCVIICICNVYGKDIGQDCL